MAGGAGLGARGNHGSLRGRSRTNSTTMGKLSEQAQPVASDISSAAGVGSAASFDLGSFGCLVPCGISIKFWLIPSRSSGSRVNWMALTLSGGS